MFGSERFGRVAEVLIALAGALALMVASAGCGSSSTDTASQASTTVPVTVPLAASQQLVDDYVHTEQVPGVVLAVSIKGGPPTILTSGVSDPRAGTPMKADDVFNVGSITKTFTAALVLQLVRDGKVDLDAPINTYGVNFPNGDQITVRQLLNHTSGIPPEGDEGGSDLYAAEYQQKLLSDLSHHYTPTEVLDWVRDRPLLFAPGTGTSYSNTNAILAGQIVERVTGQPLVELYHRQLLDPLGLDTTHYAAEETLPVPAIPGQFSLQPGGPLVITTDFDSTAVATSFGAAGAMASTAADLITWGNALLRDGTVLGPDLSEQAHTISPGGTGLGVIGFDAQWSCFPNLSHPCPPGTTFVRYGHDGSVPGADSVLVYDPATDTVIVALANRTTAHLFPLVQQALALIANPAGSTTSTG